MSRRPRRNHTAAFKAKVAIEALGDGKTIAEIAQKHDVHPHQVTEWRRQLIERAAGVFGAVPVAEAATTVLRPGSARVSVASVIDRLPAWSWRLCGRLLRDARRRCRLRK